ncbi:Aste57867_14822 [Aphanomyces stellatus]|uniref:Aste57867_14822 protein n=1 Tax=Aphanomyces stellatus TaxID=120398 RepID=A0A485L2M3_9STRA|nr:hypothetical protein As57867_014766 [Aphanomyces stellatus]VFT91640.1 Aste57867_14822 [Aphanomyces stellatus]
MSSHPPTPDAATPDPHGASSSYDRFHDDDETGTRDGSFLYSARYSEAPHVKAFERGILKSDRAIPVVEQGDTPKHAKAFNGRIKRWPGVLLLLLVVAGAVCAIVYKSNESHQASVERRDAYQQALADRARIASGLEDSTTSKPKNVVDDDGVINNPKVYPPQGCELPDYQSKKGKIWAVSRNGTEVPVAIKGVNWFGMETGMQAPFGLWDNDQNGTTVYAIADFLSANKFNSVRLPLCVQNILDNKPLEASIVNRVTNRAGCELPDYQSKKGKIWAVSRNGTEVPVAIKGVNWFGMETGMQAPFGLWDNDQNGTTVYAIADFLSANKFNSVRLPLCVQNILDNKPLEASIVNRVTNRAVDLSSYLALLQSIVKGLGYRKISVMISMHTLDRMNGDGSLWYGKTTTEDDFLKSIDMLTKALCSDTYWNVLGIDIKNEPFEGSWGTGEKNDFKAASERISARMLKGCPNWMGFVEGINQQNSIVLDGEEYEYYDWFGGGLHKAKGSVPKFALDNKLVFAPHYYTPAVFPQYYLFGGGTVGSKSAIIGYKELSNEKLAGRVRNTMNDMFGFLNDHKGPAVLLGEFAGLYTKDAHPMKTTQRCTDYTVQVIVEDDYAGGYMWSLNPESAYQYNPADTPGNFVEGLLELDWRTANKPFLKALSGLDVMKDLKPMPCFSTNLNP